MDTHILLMHHLSETVHLFSSTGPEYLRNLLKEIHPPAGFDPLSLQEKLFRSDMLLANSDMKSLAI